MSETTIASGLSALSAIITIPLAKNDQVSTVMLYMELLEHGVFVNPVTAAFPDE